MKKLLPRGNDGRFTSTLPIVAITLLGMAQATDASDRPNLILIVADDLGSHDLGFLGRTQWKTPNLDNLAKNGRVLTRCYAAAPICGPSRASLLTGRAPRRTRVRTNQDDLPASEVTLAEALRDHGYVTGIFGKWHRGRPPEGASEGVHPMDQGFSEFLGFLDPTHAWEKFPRRLWNDRQRVDVQGYADDLFTNRAIEFIEHHQHQPFFLYFAPTAPHFNIQAPDDEVDLHRPRLPERDPAHPLNTTYAALVTRLDSQVGRLLALIEKLRLSEHTLVVFTSDNGATFEAGNQRASRSLDSNFPFRGQKRTLWEGGIRVPTVVAWPGKIQPGTSTSQPVSHLDFFPTLLAAAGTQPQNTSARPIDGLDLLPNWTNSEQIPPDRTLYWEWSDERANQRAALRGEWKLMIQGNQRPELYHLLDDPAERLDRSAEEPDLIESLTLALEAWLERPEAAGN